MTHGESPGSTDSFSFDFNCLPEPAAQKIFFYLRWHEIRNVQKAVGTLRFSQFVDYAKVLAENRTKKCSNFIWLRVADEKKEEDRMAPRVCHSMVNHEKEGSMYIFGGRACCRRDEDGVQSNEACFNDLWKLDLATKTALRVIVSSAPYPLPKSGATMNMYNDEILLFGGRRPMPPGRIRMVPNTNTNEIHLFNTRTNSWRQLVTINEAPSLFGHSAVVCDDYLIAYGGTLNWFTLNTTFRILNLKTLRWFVPHLSGVPKEFVVNENERIATLFPIYGAESTSLIVLKPGRLLLLGECRPPSRSNVAVLISFNSHNPEESSWNWRLIPASGKWFEGIRHLVGPSQHRNSKFTKVVPLYGKDFVRLVTVGLPSPSSGRREIPRIEKCLMEGTNVGDRVNFVDGRSGLSAFVAFVVIQHISRAIESVWDKPEKLELWAESEKDDLVINKAGIRIKAKNFFKEFSKVMKGQIRNGIEIETRIEGDEMATRKLVDCSWLKSVTERSIQFYVDFCQKKSEKLSLKLPYPPLGIFRCQPHLVSYSALIPLGEEDPYISLNEIIYEEGDSHYFCPPSFHDFALCAARNEVVLHGGELQKYAMPHVTYFMMPSTGQKPQ